MLLGLKFYRYNGGAQNPPICANNCEGTAGGSCNQSSDNNCNNGAGNYFVVQGTNGWEFRQLHLNHSAVYSYTKYADKGNILGHWGSTGFSTAPHGHADNRLNGVRQPTWYEPYGFFCGLKANWNFVVGRPLLQ
jgi:hypothetical protein